MAGMLPAESPRRGAARAHIARGHGRAHQGDVRGALRSYGAAHRTQLEWLRAITESLEQQFPPPRDERRALGAAAANAARGAAEPRAAPANTKRRRIEASYPASTSS